jgi:DME family drug/metabolite transporter
LLAITGCVILTLSGGGTVRVDPVGIALAIGAGIAYAAYALAIKGLMENHTPNIVIAVTFSLGALMIAPLMIGREMNWLASPRSIAVILHLGLVTAALAYWLFARGLQRVPVATAVTLSLAEPLVAGLLGLLLLGEQLNSLSFVGIALIFSGLAVLTFRRRTATSGAFESSG